MLDIRREHGSEKGSDMRGDGSGGGSQSGDEDKSDTATTDSTAHAVGALETHKNQDIRAQPNVELDGTRSPAGPSRHGTPVRH